MELNIYNAVSHSSKFQAILSTHNGLLNTCAHFSVPSSRITKSD